MEVRLHEDVAAFAALARPLLDADPVRHTVAQTVLDGLLRTGDRAAALVTVHDGAVVGAALRSALRPVVVSALPAGAAPAVAALLAEADPELPGVTGPVERATAFARAHAELAGTGLEVTLRTRLFALDALRPPAGVPGAARRATAADLDLLAAWLLAFVDEAVGGWRDPAPPRETVARGLRLGHAQLLWESGGEPVALAAARSPVAGVVRVGPVYTPPEHRGRGYGSAVTAAATAWGLRAGARQVVLFTDLANPTTNAIYPRLGYRPVGDAVEIAFRRTDEGAAGRA